MQDAADSREKLQGVSYRYQIGITYTYRCSMQVIVNG